VRCTLFRPFPVRPDPFFQEEEKKKREGEEEEKGEDDDGGLPGIYFLILLTGKKRRRKGKGRMLKGGSKRRAGVRLCDGAGPRRFNIDYGSERKKKEKERGRKGDEEPAPELPDSALERDLRGWGKKGEGEGGRGKRRRGTRTTRLEAASLWCFSGRFQKHALFDS